jgi:putative transposase
MMRRIFLYLLAVCSEHFGIQIHVAVLMSTHEHLILTDVRGNLPRFLERFHRLVALATKVLRKWDGPVWDTNKTSVVRLESEQAIIEKMAYVLANPVSAGLVHRSDEWPGVTQPLTGLGEATELVERPDAYLDAANPLWPEQTELSFSMPPALSDQFSREGVIRRVGVELEQLEAKARAAVRAKRWRVPGARRVRRFSPTKRARSFEESRTLNPTFATGRGRRELYVRVARRLREFRATYRESFAAWREGARDVRFPFGTWEMVQVHGARGAPDEVALRADTRLITASAAQSAAS